MLSRLNINSVVTCAHWKCVHTLWWLMSPQPKQYPYEDIKTTRCYYQVPGTAWVEVSPIRARTADEMWRLPGLNWPGSVMRGQNQACGLYVPALHSIHTCGVQRSGLQPPRANDSVEANRIEPQKEPIKIKKRRNARWNLTCSSADINMISCHLILKPLILVTHA